jgi:hypothetical protein
MAKYPDPDHPRRAPIWGNHVTAAVVEACLGCVPAHARAVGVIPAGWDIVVRLLMSAVDEADLRDMREIERRLTERLGPRARVVFETNLAGRDGGFGDRRGRVVYRESDRAQERDRGAW